MDRAEAAGFGVAVTGHAALLAAMTLGLATAINPPTSSNPIEVSFVEDVGLTSAAPQTVEVPPEQGMAPEVGPPEDSAPPEHVSPSPPEAEPQPRQAVTQPRATPTPPLDARARTRPKPSDQPSKADRRPRLGRDILSGFGTDPAPKAAPRPAAAMTGEARASINAAIRRALLPCQRQNLPAPEAAEVQVVVNVTLNRDGSLAEAAVSRVINTDPDLERYERRMRDLALNVIRQCTPIRGLPAELYDVPRGWRRFPYTFDARRS
jgi:outer membrane biosynthesis protein TonB